MRKSLYGLFIMSFGVAVAAQAQNQTPHRQYKKPLAQVLSGQGYGLAGCGLGSIVFGPQPGMIQVVAATLNGTSYSQSIGITSGTSNCDIPRMGAQAAAFIHVNKEVVMKDAARGSGETINALADILDCSDASVLGANMQKNYSNYFDSKNNSYEISRRLLKAIKTNSTLKAVCKPV